MPSIIEAMKTLDYNTFYKSVDAAQMLYIHGEPQVQPIQNADKLSLEQMKELAKNFNPLDDDNFMSNLNQRGKLKLKSQKFEQKEGQSASHMPMPELKWRHGLSPGAKNITNIRHKLEPIVDSK